MPPLNPPQHLLPLGLITALMLALALAGGTHAQTGTELDPARLMQGFPPLPSYQIHIGNWQQYPQKIWSFQHTHELFPTRPLQAMATVRPLPVAPQIWPPPMSMQHWCCITAASSMSATSTA